MNIIILTKAVLMTARSPAAFYPSSGKRNGAGTILAGKYFRILGCDDWGRCVSIFKRYTYFQHGRNRP